MGKKDLPEECPKEVTMVNVGDSRAMRHALDDKITELVTDGFGYEVDNWMSNMKIALGMSAILCGIAVHVIPVPFPANRPILLIGCVLYALFSGVMQLLMTYVEGSTLFMSTPNAKGQRVRITPIMGAFSPEYKLVVDLLPPHAGSLHGYIDAYRTHKTLCSSTHTWSVGKFFDERGILYTPGVEAALREALAEITRMEKKKE
eukprot:TRINITY_DN30533_c0_g1_i1.p2 TRINITY_DN30533_c0_g1~~TRINITY_DN30533_c0_g1_i1.p2  ORF type:complete len:203 (+),score=65.40 TRINITY_DN30533_c0_g1_i1:52-660(+)